LPGGAQVMELRRDGGAIDCFARRQMSHGAGISLGWGMDG
jgi:hypothetical protein